MSLRKRIPAVLTGAALAFSPLLVAVQPAGAITPEEQAFVDAINSARAAAGLAPLTVSDALTVLAERHSASMASTGTLAHSTDLAGTIGSAYPNWTHIGENVGYGSSVTQINSAFMGSTEHKANILGDYNLVGVGISTNPGGVMWVTELFAKAVVDSASLANTPVTSSTASPTTASPTATAPVTTTAPAPTVTSAPSTPAKSPKGSAHAAAHAANASSMGAARSAAGLGGRHGPPAWAHNKNGR